MAQTGQEKRAAALAVVAAAAAAVVVARGVSKRFQEALAEEEARVA